MGVTSKVARHDARSFFYASTDTLFYGDDIKNLGHFGFLHRLFQTMGPGGAASLCSMQFESRLRPMDDSCQGRLAFQGFLSSVALCSNPRFFNKDLSVYHVFGSDLQGLKALFLHDHELPFPGLEKTVQILASLPALTEVHVNIRPHTSVSEGRRLRTMCFCSTRSAVCVRMRCRL